MLLCAPCIRDQLAKSGRDEGSQKYLYSNIVQTMYQLILMCIGLHLELEVTIYIWTMTMSHTKYEEACNRCSVGVVVSSLTACDAAMEVDQESAGASEKPARRTLVSLYNGHTTRLAQNTKGTSFLCLCTGTRLTPRTGMESVFGSVFNK